ncbi:capping complex subunit for YIEGIA [Cohnella pontilimi]|nr:hypothetical protein [Cohnella pontilimi]
MARIVALITTRKEDVAGGAPIFIAGNRAELEKTAFMLEKLLDCGAHELNHSLFLLVDRNTGDH